MRLEPRYLCMVIPSRWLAGGKGLDEFRECDARRQAHAQPRRLPEARTRCFPAWRFEGGICYFLWDRDTRRDRASVTIIRDGVTIGPAVDALPR